MAEGCRHEIIIWFSTSSSKEELVSVENHTIDSKLYHTVAYAAEAKTKNAHDLFFATGV